MLRKELSRSKKGKVKEGTVVRFVSGGLYTYVAVFVNNKWYLTGKGYFGGTVLSNEQFIEKVLSKVEDIEVATVFEAVE
jgi:hypothetical protein